MSKKGTNILQKDHTLNRTFEYTKGQCNLKFTLRVDIKSQLKDFKDLLLSAVADVEEEIKKL